MFLTCRPLCLSLCLLANASTDFAAQPEPLHQRCATPYWSCLCLAASRTCVWLRTFFARSLSVPDAGIVQHKRGHRDKCIGRIQAPQRRSAWWES